MSKPQDFVTSRESNLTLTLAALKTRVSSIVHALAVRFANCGLDVASFELKAIIIIIIIINYSLEYKF